MQWFKVNRRLVWGLKFNPENLPALVALTPDLKYHEKVIGPGCSEATLRHHELPDPARIGDWVVWDPYIKAVIGFLPEVTFRRLFEPTGY